MKLLSNLRETDRSQTLSFYPADTQELYKKNLKTQPSDWRWRNLPINYSLNSQGFRCKEFDSLDWNKSILTFGCSNTFGVGVNDTDTWPHKLGLFLQKPIINLAQGGQGWGFNWVNSVRVIEAGHKPLAVVYYWPSTERMFTLPDARNPNLVLGHGIWNTEKNALTLDTKLGLYWASDPRIGNFWAKQYKLSLDIMWGQLGVPVYHFTWVHQHPIQEIEYIPLYSNPKDLTVRARDLMHPGPADCSRIALRICISLKDLNRKAG